MNVGLDTSVVLRLLTGEPADLAEKVLARVMAVISAGGRCTVNDLVVSEAYFGLQHHYGMPKAAALAALADMSQAPGFSFSPSATSLLQMAGLARSNPGFIDRLIHADYRHAASGMLTCERAASRLSHVEVISP